MVLSLSATETELDHILTAAKAKFPQMEQLQALEQVRLDGPAGVRIKYKAPIVGTVDVQVQLEITGAG